MKPLLSATLAGVTVLAGLVLTAGPASATHHIPCHAGGPTAADNALAAKLRPWLTGDMHTGLTGEALSCARVIVQTTKTSSAVRAGSPRAAVIAVTTAIVESGIINHDKSTDHDSLGLYEQRASWGTAAQRTDPVYSTGLFLRALAGKPDWRTGQIGEVCQEVQNSAFPDRYQPQAPDAQQIVTALWSSDSHRDMNNDGRSDVVFAGQSSDGTTTLGTWLSNGSGFGGAVFTGTTALDTTSSLLL